MVLDVQHLDDLSLVMFTRAITPSMTREYWLEDSPR